MSLTKTLASMLFVASCALSAHSSLADEAVKPPSLHHPIKRTPLTKTQLVAVLRDAHVRVFGEAPTANTLAMAWAQIALENDSGLQIYGKNIGNVVKTHADEPYFVNPHDHYRYRWFDDFVDGAVVYWTVMQHCTPALQSFKWGNPTLAATWLKRCGYFEADVAPYIAGMKKWFGHAKSTVLPQEERERQERDRQAALTREIAGYASTAGAPAVDAGCD